jgi:hypothetical protein
MSEKQSLFGIVQEFQRTVGASKDLEIICQLFRTVLYSANTIPETPLPTKQTEQITPKTFRLTRSQRKKQQQEEEYQKLVTRQLQILKDCEKQQHLQSPPSYSQCQL